MPLEEQSVSIDQIDQGGGSPISLSMCFGQALTSVHLAVITPLSAAASVNAKMGAFAHHLKPSLSPDLPEKVDGS